MTKKTIYRVRIHLENYAIFERLFTNTPTVDDVLATLPEYFEGVSLEHPEVKKVYDKLVHKITTRLAGGFISEVSVVDNGV